MHEESFIETGNQKDPSKALILLHGRGGSAEDILSLTAHLPVDSYALYAPRATGNSWYPNSFMAPAASNEPWLTAAIDQITRVVSQIKSRGIAADQVYLLGFSQGACLALEYACRHATKYGGVAAFTGGLIGDRIYPERYTGKFNNTPFFLGTSNPDPHVPVERVKASTQIITDMGGDVTLKVYDGMGHTIVQDELNHAAKLIFS